MNLTKSQKYIKANLDNRPNINDMIEFHERFPDDFLEVKEDFENNCFDPSEISDAILNKSTWEQSLDLTTVFIVNFREYIKSQLELIEDIEAVNEIEEDESRLNLHDREEARNLNKELNQ